MKIDAVNKCVLERAVVSRLLFVLTILAALPAVLVAQHGNAMKVIPGGVWKPLYVTDSTRFTVKSFQLDVYPVTNAQFLDFVKRNPEWKKGAVKAIFADAGYLKHWESPEQTGRQAPLDAPVVNVSWFAAKKYCECQGKRLPTVAEWELAARASEKKADATADPAFNQRVLDWYASAPRPQFSRVGSTYKNYFGVWDMLGLVWEWTQDFNSALSSGDSRNNGNLDKGLFCGGGAVNVSDSKNYAAFMRYAMRSSLKANYTVANLGFRCAGNLPNK